MAQRTGGASAASTRRRAATTKPTTRRRTQAERSEETRTRILKAASHLIRKRGYARFRTAEVSAEAGLSRGAQLHHFPTKDALVVATLEFVFKQAQDLSRRRASTVNRPRDLIEAVIADAREFFFSEHFMVAIDIGVVDLDQSDGSQANSRNLAEGAAAGRDRMDRGAGRQRRSGRVVGRYRRADAWPGSRHGVSHAVGQRPEMVRRAVPPVATDDQGVS